MMSLIMHTSLCSTSPGVDTPTKRKEKSAGFKSIPNEAVPAELAVLVPSPDEVDLEEYAPVSIFLQTASYLLDVHALKFAEMALAHEVTSGRGGPKNAPTCLVAEARLHLERCMYSEAEKCLKKALMVDIQDSNAWALLGHAYFLSGDYAEAQDAYERTLGYVVTPVHIHLVYTRLAAIYLQEEKVCGGRGREGRGG